MAQFVTDIQQGGLINVDNIIYMRPTRETITTPNGEQVPAYAVILPLMGDEKFFISDEDYYFIRQRMNLRF